MTSHNYRSCLDENCGYLACADRLESSRKIEKLRAENTELRKLNQTYETGAGIHKLRTRVQELEETVTTLRGEKTAFAEVYLKLKGFVLESSKTCSCQEEFQRRSLLYPTRLDLQDRLCRRCTILAELDRLETGE